MGSVQPILHSRIEMILSFPRMFPVHQSPDASDVCISPLCSFVDWKSLDYSTEASKTSLLGHRDIPCRSYIQVNKDQDGAYPGHLFVIEGIDGAGKTTVCDGVERNLMQRSYDVIRLREPTSESSWGKEIRSRSPTGELSSTEELELFIKDRDWNVKNRILPSLKAGKIVLMDRYFFATGAYQSTSTGIHWKEILRRNREGIDAPEPDIVVILDISAEEGLERVLDSRGKRNEQFEQLERLIKVRQAYLEMIREDSGNYLLIDATKPVEQVIEGVTKAILGYLR